MGSEHQGGYDHRNHGHGKHGHYGKEPEDLYGKMRACGHYLYHQAEGGAGQGKILHILAKRESMTQRELQDLLQIQPGSLSEVLTKLEAKGMIVRSRDEEDRRRSILTLTETGRKAAGQKEERTSLFAALNLQEQEELQQLLGKLLDSWK
jgi:DNA-binding MarR family transcriptional regulator